MPTAPLLSSSVGDKSHTGRVLSAISRDERDLFFPQGIVVPCAEVIQCEMEEAGAFWKILDQYRPDALVASWSTPAIQREWLDAMPCLRYICYTSGSVRNIVPRAFLERGGMITNWGTLASKNVAEHALLLVLAGLRHINEWPPVIAGERPWHPSPVITRTLYGKRVALHGFGNVARSLAALLQPFGVSISAYSAGVPKELYLRHGVSPCENLEELFGDNDIFVECEALTPKNKGIVTRELLQKLPQGTLFVNVGRGAIVDENALADLAQSGHLRLALDVYATDPIAPDSPLHHVEQAILSPHIAGPTNDQFARCGALAQKNLNAFFSGQPLEAIVTLDIYDRAT